MSFSSSQRHPRLTEQEVALSGLPYGFYVFVFVCSLALLFLMSLVYTAGELQHYKRLHAEQQIEIQQLQAQLAKAP